MKVYVLYEYIEYIDYEDAIINLGVYDKEDIVKKLVKKNEKMKKSVTVHFNYETFILNKGKPKNVVYD